MMQIKELVLYGKNRKKRTLTFNFGKVNIITGKSKSGKSAIGDIIEYCMGGSKCNVADGVVREKVDWYGLLLQFSTNRVFIARKNPEPGQQSTSLCYCEVGVNLKSPESADFQENTNVEGIEGMLSRQLGVSENIHLPNKGQSRMPLQANVRHALFYCFQSQDEIAARSMLFHRQAEDPFITQAIKDTLPYFLGAVSEKVVFLLTEKRNKARELKMLESRLAMKDALSVAGTERAAALLAEAASVGLINELKGVEDADFNVLYEILASIELKTEHVPVSAMDKLTSLQMFLAEKLDKLTAIQANIDDVKQYITDANGFNDETNHQKVRLESIGLFETLNFETGKCPLCSGELKPEPPGVMLLKNSIRSLDQAINTVLKERPQLRRYLDEQEEEASEIKAQITKLKAEIDAVYEQIADAKSIKDLNDRRAKVYGRISYWLENVQPTPDDVETKKRIVALQARIQEIDEIISNDSVQDRMNSALSVISKDMTEWAVSLDMEYAGSPYRLDMSKVTVVADRERPVVLREMGSASNWLGAHLITMFALHKYFISRNRPVPGFLFLDQPSQVYFPEGSTAEEDMDIQAVTNTYSFIRKCVGELNSGLQVIVVDHAKLDDDNFREEIIEDWKNPNNNLVPTDW